MTTWEIPYTLEVYEKIQEIYNKTKNIKLDLSNNVIYFKYKPVKWYNLYNEIKLDRKLRKISKGVKINYISRSFYGFVPDDIKEIMNKGVFKVTENNRRTWIYVESTDLPIDYILKSIILKGQSIGLKWAALCDKDDGKNDDE